MPLMRPNSRAARPHVRLVTISTSSAVPTRGMPAGASTHPHTDCCSSPHSSRLCHTSTAHPPRHPLSPSSRHPLVVVRRRRPLCAELALAPPVKARQFPGWPSAPRQSSSKFRGARGLRQNPSNPSKSVKSQTPFGPLALLSPYEFFQSFVFASIRIYSEYPLSDALETRQKPPR